MDYVAEAVRLLNHLGQGETFGEFKKELVRKYNVCSVAFEEKFCVITEIEEDARRKLKGKEEELRKYFFSTQKDGSCLGNMALLWDGFTLAPYASVEDLQRELEGLSEAEYCKRYSELLYCYVAAIQDEWERKYYDNPMEVIRFLMDMDIPEEEKWKLQQIFLKPQEHREKIYSLMECVMDVLLEHRETLDKLAADFAVYWERKLEGSTIAEYINAQIGVDLEENPLGIGMHPSFLEPSTISVYAKSEEDGHLSTPYIFTIGFLFDDDFIIHFSGNDNRGNQEYALKVLKMLSDSSKFEILSYIKDKNAYGSQLAKHLGLTTATISHHMSALLSAGLVTMETRESKVYYKGNTKAIAEVLEYCKQVLAL